MSYDAASFFRGISAKINAARRAGGDGVAWRRKERREEEEPQQPVTPPAVTTSASSPAPPRPQMSSLLTVAGAVEAAGGGAQPEQIHGSLMTQARQTSPQLSSADVVDGEEEDDDDDDDPNGVPDANYADDNNNNFSDVSQFGTRPKVHAAAVVARTRKIQSMPKNTSPIAAKDHASLLPRQMPIYHGKKTLILDVDETLVHSSLSYQPKHHDLVLHIRMDRGTTTVYVAFRPFLKNFLQSVAPLFEIVVFTASVSIYCNPLMDAVDPDGILGKLRLYREHCSLLNGAYVKDLSLLGRDLDQVAILDNSPVTYLFQQRNAIPIPSWFDDRGDNELMQLIPMLNALAQAPDVYDVLDSYNALLQLRQEQV